MTGVVRLRFQVLSNFLLMLSAAMKPGLRFRNITQILERRIAIIAPGWKSATNICFRAWFSSFPFLEKCAPADLNEALTHIYQCKKCPCVSFAAEHATDESERSAEAV